MSEILFRLAALPPELIVAFIAAAPIAELRGAIPLGVLYFRLSPIAAAVFSILGNSLPILAVYGLGGAWIRWVERRRGFWHRLTDKLLRRTHRVFKDDYERYGLVALALFVAIPLPFTGAWSGALAAFIFGIPFRKAFPTILIGVTTAAVIVTLAVTGTVSILRIFLILDAPAS